MDGFSNQPASRTVSMLKSSWFGKSGSNRQTF
jgi:hypothetical protein